MRLNVRDRGLFQKLFYTSIILLLTLTSDLLGENSHSDGPKARDVNPSAPANNCINYLVEGDSTPNRTDESKASIVDLTSKESIISPDGKTITEHSSLGLKFLDTATGKLLLKEDIAVRDWKTILSPDRHLLIFLEEPPNENFHTKIFNTTTGKPISPPFPYPIWWNDRLRFSREGNHASFYLDTPNGETLAVANFSEPKKSFSVELKGRLKKREFSFDSQDLVFSDADGIHSMNLTNGKVVSFPGGEDSFAVSPTASVAVTRTREKNGSFLLRLIDLKTGNSLAQQEVPENKEITGEIKFLHDGKTIALEGEHGILLWNSQDKALRPLSNLSSPEITLSPDGEFLVSQERRGISKTEVYRTSDFTRVARFDNSDLYKPQVLTLNAKELLLHDDRYFTVTKIDESGSSHTTNTIKILAISPGGDRILSFDQHGKTTLREPDGKILKEYSDQDRPETANFSPEGRYFVTKVGSHYRIFSSRDGMEIKIPVPINGYAFSPDGSLYLKFGKGYSRIASICADPKYGIRGNVAKEDLTNSQGDARIAALCKEPFNEKSWDSLLPEASPELSPVTALRYLKRFQKPGGFNPEHHLSIVRAILNSDLPEKVPAQTSAMMQAILGRSPLLYQQLASEFADKFPTHIAKSETDSVCRNASETSTLATAAAEYAHRLSNSFSSNVKLTDFATLRPLKSVLATLPLDDRQTAVHHLAEKLTNSASDSTDLHGVFRSKLYKLAYQSVSDNFGISPKEVTDLTFIRDADTLRPLILGTAAIDGDATTQTPFGIYRKAFPEVQLPKPGGKDTIPVTIPLGDKVNEVHWKLGNHTYSAAVKVEALSKSLSATSYKDGFPFEDLRRGGLNGIIMTGTNLRDNAKWVMDQYLEYYAAKGFHFEPDKPVTDVPKFMREKIQSGEVDYLIKEAHSDGDDQNLFRIDKNATVKVGTLRKDDGMLENIFLIYPSSTETQNQLMSNHEFGEMVRAREKTSKSPLVYFNTSCWSATKAVNELDAADSDMLIDIPSTTLCYSFQNRKGNRLFQMIESFRNGDNLKETLKASKLDEVSPESDQDVYLYPGTPEYERRIEAVRKLRLNIEVKVKDGQGKPYYLDDLH
jgi:hypothetical protein